ncbi:unnamed protein product [Withania somnifera]
MANRRKLAFDDVAYIIPSDILFLILIRVPSVKSLLRFKSVSKPWNATISDNEFKRTHRDQSKALGREKLLVHKRSTNEFEFRDLETSRLVRMAKEIFPPEKFRKAIVLCSGDGLLLLKNPKAYKIYILWNPSTGDYKTLRCPYFNKNRQVPNACGLCYDSSVDDYKVIFIYKSSYAIYSLNNDCWTEKAISLRVVVTLLQNCCLSGGISIRGCVFWPYYSHYVVRNSTIIYFDGTSDELKQLPLPNFVGVNDWFRVTSLKSCLCLYGGNKESLALDIWIMERDGWKLLLNMSKLRAICKTFIESKVLLCCTRNGEILFRGCGRCGLFIYYPRTQVLREANISKVYSRNQNFPLISTCLESL